MDLSFPKQCFNIQKFLDVSPHSCRAQLCSPSGNCEAVIYQLSPAILMAVFDFQTKTYCTNPNRRSHILEINYCLQGRLEHILADGSFCYISKNDLVFHLESSHTPEAYMPLGYYQGLGFVFDLDRLGQAELYELPFDVGPLLEKILSFKSEMYVSVDSQLLNLNLPPDDWSEASKIAWMRLKVQELFLYLEHHHFDAASCQKVYERQLVELVKNIQHELLSNLQCRYTIEELAKTYFISPTKLKQAFKTIYGEPIGIYMKRYRMQQAAEWLRESDRSVEEISSLLGYQSASKFSAAFRSVMNCSPVSYRKKL